MYPVAGGLILECFYNHFIRNCISGFDPFVRKFFNRHGIAIEVDEREGDEEKRHEQVKQACEPVPNRESSKPTSEPNGDFAQCWNWKECKYAHQIKQEMGDGNADGCI